MFAQPIILVRRVLFVVLDVTLFVYPNYKYAMFALLNLSLLMIQAILQPFRTREQRCFASFCLSFDV